MPRTQTTLPAFISTQLADGRHFYFDPRTRAARELAVVCGGWERAAADYRISRQGLRYFACEFVVGGRGWLRMRGRSHPLARGSVFAYGPGIAHDITTDPDDPLSKYFVDLAGPGAGPALAAAGLPPGVCSAVADPGEVQTAFERLLTAGRRGTPAAPRMAALQAEILLLVVAESRMSGDARSFRARQTFLRCRETVDQGFARFRTAEDAAAACGVAPEYLSRLFRRFAGQPVYRYLMRLKMNQAAALLNRGAVNVSEAAEALRMDPFQFSRAFKRVHGRPPSTFLARAGR